jgi:hypothetical protein
LKYQLTNEVLKKGAEPPKIIISFGFK